MSGSIFRGGRWLQLGRYDLRDSDSREAFVRRASLLVVEDDPNAISPDEAVAAALRQKRMYTCMGVLATDSMGASDSSVCGYGIAVQSRPRRGNDVVHLGDLRVAEGYRGNSVGVVLLSLMVGSDFLSNSHLVDPHGWVGHIGESTLEDPAPALASAAEESANGLRIIDARRAISIAHPGLYDEINVSFWPQHS
jgi:hypothetical protein